MNSYHIISKHPKFEVEFPVDGLKPLPKQPSSIQKASTWDSLEDLVDKPDKSTTFVRFPTTKEPPIGRETSKWVNITNLNVYKVSEKTQYRQDTTHYKTCS